LTPDFLHQVLIQIAATAKYIIKAGKDNELITDFCEELAEKCLKYNYVNPDRNSLTQIAVAIDRFISSGAISAGL